MIQKCDGWIVITGGGFIIYKDLDNKIWNAHRDITVFTNRNEVNKVQQQARKLPLSKGKTRTYRVYINRSD